MKQKTIKNTKYPSQTMSKLDAKIKIATDMSDMIHTMIQSIQTDITKTITKQTKKL